MPGSRSQRTAETPTRILCIDDNSDMLLMMQMLIGFDKTMQSIGALTSAKNLAAYIESLPECPNVIVLDATIPGDDPLAEMKYVSVKFPSIRTIVYSGHDDPAFVSLAMSQGAWTCISKRGEPDVIINAIRTAARGGTSFPDTQN